MTPHEQVLALRRRGGFCPLPDLAVVEVSGIDAAKFLQARMSNDVFGLQPGQGQLSALLDRKAHILAYLSLHRLADTFLMLMEKSQADAVMHQLETYHFQEKVAYRSLEWRVFTIQGPMTPMIAPKLDEFGVLQIESGVVVIRKSLTGDPGYLFFADNEPAFDPIEQEAKALDMVPLSAAALDIARVEAGFPAWNIDFSVEQLLPETGLENVAASYAKGCYQGQEVLARIRTYGAPRRGLVGLAFEAGAKLDWPNGTALLKNNEDVGTIKSNVFSPTLNQTIALAYVQRELRVPDQKLEFTIDGQAHTATVVALPFYSPEARRKVARTKYDAALAEFTTGSELKAIEELREVVRLDPMFGDAYEALGVALSRQDQLDEAIQLMKQLERLDPESIMAHTNLSIFYMQKGDKEAAEDEKAKAMSIRMSQMAREYNQQQSAEAELKKRKDEAEQRMSMFKQVLEIDPEDFLANAGMGSAYVDLERYADAVPYLEKALAAKPNHTVAYVTLAQALEKLGQVDKAIEIYKKGVAIAAQRGDMTPMKDMQLQLARLGAR